MEEETSPQPKPRIRRDDPEDREFNLLTGIAIFFVSVILVAILAPNFIRARAQGRGGGCKSNLKNLGTAMEMYSTDWSGKYPPLGKAQLTPKYLKTIPECPAAGTDTYKFLLGPTAPGNTQSYQDYYFIYCQGDNHGPVGRPPNYPQYNGIVGLIER